MKARIYKPAKTAMQSGGAGSGDTCSQIGRKSDSFEEAEDYATRKGLDIYSSVFLD